MELGFVPYNRVKSIAYARRWAYGRNPIYYDFEQLGGDCTNFASQCLYAGIGIMNFTPDLGWFYLSPTERAAAWTGVEYFAKFLLRSEKSPGPFAELAKYSQLLPGDFIQLSTSNSKYNHTPVVISVGKYPNPSNILVAAHSYDTYGRPLSSYRYRSIRCLHILGAYKGKKSEV